jgi:DNA mismatch endonuclease (patch repair protein)
MADTFTKSQRSRIMAAVKSRHTKPEMIVRQIVHQLGYRFRLHRSDLPGTPDIVLNRFHAIINIHGCFWHQHSCPAGHRMPKSRTDYWTKKLNGNAVRDRRNLRRLRRGGWKVLTIWECQVKDAVAVQDRVARFLAEN